MNHSEWNVWEFFCYFIKLFFFSCFSRQKRVGGIAYTVHGSTNIKSDFYFQDFEACGQTSVDKKPNALWARDGKASDFKISFWAIHAFNLTGLANRTQSYPVKTITSITYLSQLKK